MFISRQVFIRIVEVKDIYSFAEYLGAVVRDIILGYHSETIQKMETGPTMTRIGPRLNRPC